MAPFVKAISRRTKISGWSPVSRTHNPGQAVNSPVEDSTPPPPPLSPNNPSCAKPGGPWYSFAKEPGFSRIIRDESDMFAVRAQILEVSVLLADLRGAPLYSVRRAASQLLHQGSNPLILLPKTTSPAVLSVYFDLLATHPDLMKMSFWGPSMDELSKEQRLQKIKDNFFIEPNFHQNLRLNLRTIVLSNEVVAAWCGMRSRNQLTRFGIESNPGPMVWKKVVAPRPAQAPDPTLVSTVVAQVGSGASLSTAVEAVAQSHNLVAPEAKDELKNACQVQLADSFQRISAARASAKDRRRNKRFSQRSSVKRHIDQAISDSRSDSDCSQDLRDACGADFTSPEPSPLGLIMTDQPRGGIISNFSSHKISVQENQLYEIPNLNFVGIYDANHQLTNYEKMLGFHRGWFVETSKMQVLLPTCVVEELKTFWLMHGRSPDLHEFTISVAFCQRLCLQLQLSATDFYSICRFAPVVAFLDTLGPHQHNVVIVAGDYISLGWETARHNFESYKVLAQNCGRFAPLLHFLTGTLLIWFIFRSLLLLFQTLGFLWPLLSLAGRQTQPVFEYIFFGSWFTFFELDHRIFPVQMPKDLVWVAYLLSILGEETIKRHFHRRGGVALHVFVFAEYLVYVLKFLYFFKKSQNFLFDLLVIEIVILGRLLVALTHYKLTLMNFEVACVLHFLWNSSSRIFGIVVFAPFVNSFLGVKQLEVCTNGIFMANLGVDLVGLVLIGIGVSKLLPKDSDQIAMINSEVPPVDKFSKGSGLWFTNPKYGKIADDSIKHVVTRCGLDSEQYSPVCFESNFHNELSAVHHRILKPTLQPNLARIKRYFSFVKQNFSDLFPRMGHIVPLSFEQYLKGSNAKPGVKRTLQKTYDELVSAGYSPTYVPSVEELKKWTVRSSFVKVENLCYRSPCGIKCKAPRLIQGASPYLIVIVGPWVAAMQLVLKRRWGLSNSFLLSGGLNSKQVATFLSGDSHHKYLEDDVSAWDASVCSELLFVNIFIYSEMGAPVAVLLIMYADVFTRGYTLYGIFYFRPGMVKSGNPDTYIGNCIINILVHVFIYHEATGHTLSQIRIEIRMVACGDDNAMRLPVTVNIDWQKNMSEFGFESVALVREHLWQLEFCSCRVVNVRDKYGPCVAFAPKIGKLISKMMYFHSLPQVPRLQLVRGVALGLQQWCFLPPISALVQFYLARTAGVEPIFVKQYLDHRMHLPFQAETTDQTWVDLYCIYGWTNRDQKELERELYSSSLDAPLPKVLDKFLLHDTSGPLGGSSMYRVSRRRLPLKKFQHVILLGLCVLGSLILLNCALECTIGKDPQIVISNIVVPTTTHPFILKMSSPSKSTKTVIIKQKAAKKPNKSKQTPKRHQQSAEIKVTDNLLTTSRYINRGPRVKAQSHGGVLVSHSETGVQVSCVNNGAFSSWQMALTPINNTLFPYLNSFAQAHDLYRFNKLSVKYVPVLSKTSSGLTVMAFDYNAVDMPPQTLTTLLSNEGAVRGPLCEPLTCHFNPKNDRVKKYLCNGADITSVINPFAQVDLPDRAPATLNVGTIYGNTSAVCGLLTVEYECEFFAPHANDDVIPMSMWTDSYTGISTAGPFTITTNQVLADTNVALTESTSPSINNVIKFSKPNTYYQVEIIQQATTNCFPAGGGGSNSAIGLGSLVSCSLVSNWLGSSYVECHGWTSQQSNALSFAIFKLVVLTGTTVSGAIPAEIPFFFGTNCTPANARWAALQVLELPNYRVTAGWIAPTPVDGKLIWKKFPKVTPLNVTTFPDQKDQKEEECVVVPSHY
jgi:hypothetical protein